jgi:two-component system chemotaxis response regulator CheB
MTKALVVDDSALMRHRIGQLLAARGCTVATARNGAHALEVLREFAPDVVTLDINMPEMDGLTCLARLMAERPTPVVMISSLTEQGALATLEALQLGAVDYVHKPDGTVSLGLERVEDEIATKVLAAAGARIRKAPGLSARLRADSARIARSAAKPAPAPARDALVLIGASTGGPVTLEEILSGLDARFPLPILICQHMPASFTGPFAARLDQVCALRVREVTRPTVIEPGHVLIGRGDADLVVTRRGDRLIASSVPCDRSVPWHPSVGRLVETAAKAVPAEALIGVMLTGMGDDGAAAMAALRRAGGRTIAESEASAVVFGMPQALIRQGGAELVLDAGRIARQTTAWAARIAASRPDAVLRH